MGKLSKDHRERIATARDIAVRIAKGRGLKLVLPVFGGDTSLVAEEFGVRIRYWQNEGSQSLHIDHKSPEIFGRVLDMTWYDDGEIGVDIWHPGEWELLIRETAPSLVH